ncbi:hypothetical protein L2E82_29036 [Cichorium intybus]|uniref:Uncharacterized protein n=1 Tax=Cichorium intybus TaxID=13427 RepID=A0ACB9CX99_CICIN|nr:hypothetical protein L2E82_29036 [Cichorium intybus]
MYLGFFFNISNSSNRPPFSLFFSPLWSGYVLEHASVCLTRIVEAFAASPDKLDELCNHGLVTQTASLISTSSSGGGHESLSPSTYTGLIRLMSACASGSLLGSKTLLLLGISGILKDILSGSGHVDSMYVSPALSRPPEQTSERNFGMFKADGSVSYGIGFTGLVPSSATFVF